MTVERIVTPNRFVGLSTDTKPTQATLPRVRAGDTFYERDTGLLYITYDGTTWVEKLDPSPGVQATSLGKAEDAAHTSGDVGVMSLGVRKDYAGTLVSADGDYTPPQYDKEGNLRVNAEGGVGLSDIRDVLAEVLLELKFLRIGHVIYTWGGEVPLEAVEG